MKIMTKGFTLVEMVVVMGVLAIIGTTVLTIFGRTLQGGNKSQIIETMKQNGSSVLETLDKTIRDSENVVCPGRNDTCTFNPCKILVVKETDGDYIRYKFEDPTPIDNPTTNGVLKSDKPVKIQVDDVDETDPDFIDRICNVNDPMLPDALTLTDTKTDTGISVVNGFFTKDRSAGFSDQVSIKFDLRPAVSSSQVGQIEDQTFQTTIQLR